MVDGAFSLMNIQMFLKRIKWDLMIFRNECLHIPGDLFHILPCSQDLNAVACGKDKPLGYCRVPEHLPQRFLQGPCRKGHLFPEFYG